MKFDHGPGGDEVLPMASRPRAVLVEDITFSDIFTSCSKLDLGLAYEFDSAIESMEETDTQLYLISIPGKARQFRGLAVQEDTMNFQKGNQCLLFQRQTSGSCTGGVIAPSNLSRCMNATNLIVTLEDRVSQLTPCVLHNSYDGRDSKGKSTQENQHMLVGKDAVRCSIQPTNTNTQSLLNQTRALKALLEKSRLSSWISGDNK